MIKLHMLSNGFLADVFLLSSHRAWKNKNVMGKKPHQPRSSPIQRGRSFAKRRARDDSIWAE